MKTVILADDDADDREFFEEALREVSIQTVLITAIDGVELMTILDEMRNEPPPDAIFLDLNMPRKNGFECLKEIREITKLKNIPVIIFTTTASENAIELTYTLGANCYIPKPNSHHLLKKAIGTVLTQGFCNQEVRLSKEKFVLTILE